MSIQRELFGVPSGKRMQLKSSYPNSWRENDVLVVMGFSALSFFWVPGFSPIGREIGFVPIERFHNQRSRLRSAESGRSQYAGVVSNIRPPSLSQLPCSSLRVGFNLRLGRFGWRTLVSSWAEGWEVRLTHGLAGWCWGLPARDISVLSRKARSPK